MYYLFKKYVYLHYNIKNYIVEYIKNSNWRHVAPPVTKPPPPLKLTILETNAIKLNNHFDSLYGPTFTSSDGLDVRLQIKQLNFIIPPSYAGVTTNPNYSGWEVEALWKQSQIATKQRQYVFRYKPMAAQISFDLEVHVLQPTISNGEWILSVEVYNSVWKSNKSIPSDDNDLKCFFNCVMAYLDLLKRYLAYNKKDHDIKRIYWYSFNVNNSHKYTEPFEASIALI